MPIINESEKEYRFGDSSPKYLTKGFRVSLAVVQFQPGQDSKAHYHSTMGEDFFVFKGGINIVANGTVHHLKQGGLVHIEPLEVHYYFNPYGQTVKMISTLAPFQKAGKVKIDDYKL